MLVTQKNQYALRAVYELAKCRGQGPVKVLEIARAQNIPIRFLEVILNRIKRSGIIESKRGYTGGYMLVRDPGEVKVGDIFRAVDESLGPVECVACQSAKTKCPYQDQCAFFPMWEKVKDAIQDVFDETTIQDLLDVDECEGAHCCM